MKVGITYDLEQDYLKEGFSEEQAAEFDSIETIDAIDLALQGLGFETDRIGNIKSLVSRLNRGDRWDLVFNIAEGVHGMGREAQVPALLDAFAIPYTFSDPVVLGLTLHKGLTQRVVRSMGLRTADFAVVNSVSEIKRVDLPYPLFVKPAAEGTGKGVTAKSKVHTPLELAEVCKLLLHRFKQPVLVETYLPGREFTVGVIGTGKDASAVGVLEVHLGERAEPCAYGFHNKKNWKECATYSLARGGIAKDVAKLAVAAWRGLNCRDAGRIDIRLDGQGEPCFIEVNPLAGIRPKYSDFCILNELSGLSYRQFIKLIMESALKRAGLAFPMTEETLLESRCTA